MKNPGKVSHWLPPIAFLSAIAVMSLVVFFVVNSQTNSKTIRADVPELLIPVTGGQSASGVYQLDDFTTDYQTWHPSSGRVQIVKEALRITPGMLQNNTLVGWEITKDSLPEVFSFGADLSSPYRDDQKYGLASNITTDNSALVFLILPDAQQYYIGTWKNNSLSPFVDWSVSPYINGSEAGNRLEIFCEVNKVALIINGYEVGKTQLDQHCSMGSVGVFVLSPANPVSVDNALLQ
jgi:hypothetical protein